MDSRFSFAPFGDPGNVMMIDWSLTPATGLDMTATWWSLAQITFLESTA